MVIHGNGQRASLSAIREILAREANEHPIGSIRTLGLSRRAEAGLPDQ